MPYHMLMFIESDVDTGLNIKAFFLADVKVRPSNHTLYPIQSYPIPGTTVLEIKADYYIRLITVISLV